jgi:hypothetical protein
MISASRAGVSFKDASRLLISSFQSGMFNLHDTVDGLDKCLPATTLRSQNPSPLGRQAVITPGTL